MRFKNRRVFSSWLFDQVVTHDMGHREKIKAAILVAEWCSQIPEGEPVVITG